MSVYFYLYFLHLTALPLMICVPYFVFFSERTPPTKKRKELQEYEMVDVCMDCGVILAHS